MVFFVLPTALSIFFLVIQYLFIMVNIRVSTTNFMRWSLIGMYDKILSQDAISEPGAHLFGAKTGPDRELLTKIFVPSVELTSALSTIITDHALDHPGYPIPGLRAILVKKGSMELEANDLAGTKLKAIIVSLGMPAGVLDGLIKDLQHHNTGQPSEARCSFHILSSLLHATAKVGAEHGVWPAPDFLELFPEPDQDNGGGGENDRRGGDQQDGEGHGNDNDNEEERGGEAPATKAPPLNVRFGATMGATAMMPRTIQVKT